MFPNLIRYIKNLTPNKARFIYDFFVSFFGAISVFFILTYLNGEKLISYLVFLAPFYLVTLNLILGSYGRNKAKGILLRLTLLFISVMLVFIALIFLLNDFLFAALWLCIALPLILLPRIFLWLPKSKNVGGYILKKRGIILVVGGAGYIGSHLVNILLESGKSVRVLDNLMYGEESLEKFINHPNFELVIGDVTNISNLTEALNGVYAVVHLAGLVGDPACAVDVDFTRHTNIIATKMVKDVAQSMGVSRFIFASSCSVYGVTDIEIDEDGPLNPVSLYAKTKIDSEEELLRTVSDDFIVTILRFATVFGDSFRPRFDLVANLFTAQAMNNANLTAIGASQWRPFIHVVDLARAIQLTLNADSYRIQNQIFNVGDERLNLTILGLAEVVKGVVARFGKFPQIIIKDIDTADQRNYAVSFNKIKRILGFNASIMIEEGVAEIAEKFTELKYGDFNEDVYSNLKITIAQLDKFYDPSFKDGVYTSLR